MELAPWRVRTNTNMLVNLYLHRSAASKQFNSDSQYHGELRPRAPGCTAPATMHMKLLRWLLVLGVLFGIVSFSQLPLGSRLPHERESRAPRNAHLPLLREGNKAQVFSEKEVLW